MWLHFVTSVYSKAAHFKAQVNIIILYKVNKPSLYTVGQELKQLVQVGRSFTPPAHFLKSRT